MSVVGILREGVEGVEIIGVSCPLPNSVSLLTNSREIPKRLIATLPGTVPDETRLIKFKIFESKGSPERNKFWRIAS